MLPLLILSPTGCATTATLTAVKPASVDPGGVRRIAVLEFSGPQEVGQIAQQAVVDRLAAHGFYVVTPARELENVATAPLKFENGQLNTPAAIEAARRMDLDAIVVGELSRRRHSRFGSSSTVLIGDPVVTVSVTYRMIDVRSSNILASNRAEQSRTAEYEAPTDSPDSEQQITRDLVALCAEQAVTSIVPHDVPVPVALAGDWFGQGSAEVRAGNQLAGQGDWKAAALRWRQALAADPKNAAATYNLGLAREAARDFPAARDLYATAAARGESKRAQEALKRVEQHGGDYRLAVTQRQQRRDRQLWSPYGFASASSENSAAGTNVSWDPRRPLPASSHGTNNMPAMSNPVPAASVSPTGQQRDRSDLRRLPSG
jgi:hypothetical protein